MMNNRRSFVQLLPGLLLTAVLLALVLLLVLLAASVGRGGAPPPRRQQPQAQQQQQQQQANPAGAAAPAAAVAGRLALVGSWKMHWREGDGYIRLQGDGGYSCTWYGVDWVGVWSLDGKTLTVQEGLLAAAPGSQKLTWKVELDETGQAGLVDGREGQRFRITPGKPPPLPDF